MSGVSRMRRSRRARGILSFFAGKKSKKPANKGLRAIKNRRRQIQEFL